MFRFHAGTNLYTWMERETASSKVLAYCHKVKGTLSAIFSNTFKSQNSHFHQWEPKNNSPGLVHWKNR